MERKRETTDSFFLSMAIFYLQAAWTEREMKKCYRMRNLDFENGIETETEDCGNG